MARKKQTRKPDYRIVYFFLATGAASLAIGAWGAADGVSTLRWPRAQAEIVAAEQRLYETERRDQRQPDRRHTFAVAYVYAVDGQRYLSRNIEPGDFGMQNSGDAVTLADKYPIGSKAEVAYDPANPAVAYLKPGPSSFSLMLLGIGVAFGLAGALVRRMVRVGPGDDEEDDEPVAAPVQTKAELNPEIATYYPKRSEKQAAQ